MSEYVHQICLQITAVICVFSHFENKGLNNKLVSTKHEGQSKRAGVVSETDVCSLVGKRQLYFNKIAFLTLLNRFLSQVFSFKNYIVWKYCLFINTT